MIQFAPSLHTVKDAPAATVGLATPSNVCPPVPAIVTVPAPEFLMKYICPEKPTAVGRVSVHVPVQFITQSAREAAYVDP